MARRTCRPKPTREIDPPALTRACPECGGPLWAASKTRRTVITLDGTVRPGLRARRRRDRRCPRFGTPWRPEQEGRIIRRRHEFGLDVVAAIGGLRHAEHRGLPEIHAESLRRGVPIRVRSVDDPLDRYDKPLALALSRDDGEAGSAGSPREAVGHFVKVTRGYWPGRFACHDATDLPRTDNDPM